MDEKLKRVGPYRAVVRRGGIILTDDNQLRAFGRGPDEKAENPSSSYGADKSLNEYVQASVQNKDEIITFFHDYFFGGEERDLDLTSPEYIKATKAISQAAAKEGMGIGASVSNPLDLGRNFRAVMGVGGEQLNYTEGVVDENGNFEFDAYMAKKWVNNKGPIQLIFNRIRLFAYDEIKADGSPYIEIPFDSIREITDFTYEQSDEEWALVKSYGHRHMHIKGNAGGSCSRVFAVIHMYTPEMDYFHPDVKKYTHNIIDMYAREGVHFKELYSDEMHIQFDWDFRHFGPHELPTRHMTANYERHLAAFDPICTDFDKFLIYMAYNTDADRESYGQSHTQHVIGTTPEALYRTFYLRRLYYEELQDKVVGISIDVRDYITELSGDQPLCHGHSTWQESPTCDMFNPAGLFVKGYQAGGCPYDYAPDYVYSSTIREAIAACYDYFKWNDYFPAGGNDYCECGIFDRCYFGGAMAASLAALSELESCYWGAWGFPSELTSRFVALCVAYGTHRNPSLSIVTHGRARMVDVGFVYPKDLTSCEERFGSWMVQFGYCNYITEDKLLSLGKVDNGRLLAGKTHLRPLLWHFSPFITLIFSRF